MGSPFCSQFDIGQLTSEQQALWETVLRLAEEKGGRVLITEHGKVIAHLITVSAPAATAACPGMSL